MTSDPNDRASEQEEQMRAAALRTSRRPEGPQPTGYCLYCGAPLLHEPGRRWCDVECRNEWETLTQ